MQPRNPTPNCTTQSPPLKRRTWGPSCQVSPLALTCFKGCTLIRIPTSPSPFHPSTSNLRFHPHCFSPVSYLPLPASASLHPRQSFPGGGQDLHLLPGCAASVPEAALAQLHSWDDLLPSPTYPCSVQSPILRRKIPNIRECRCTEQSPCARH